jgi:O-antigen ligase
MKSGTARRLVAKNQVSVLPASLSRSATTINFLLASGVCVLLAFGPLAFGGVQEWAVCVLEAGAAFILTVWAIHELSNPSPRIVYHSAFLPAGLFAMLVGVQLSIQTSAYWYATWSEGLLWIAYAIVFFLMTQIFFRRSYANGFALFFSIYGFCVALFAISQQFSSNGKIYWIVSNRNLGWMYGPYVNHSHYAGLMEMLVPIPLVFAMANLFDRPIRLLFAFASLIIAVSIFLSQSLGGILSFCIEICVLAAFLLKQRYRKRIFFLVGLCVTLAIGVALLNPLGLSERLANLQHPIEKGGAAMRIAIDRDSLNMIRQRPAMGWGLGTFSTVYPSFRSFESNFFVNAAHNDFVQLIVETGVVGFLLMLIFLCLMYRAGLSSIKDWRFNPQSAMALAALVGCTGVLVHGLSDFNLKIPANAAFFSALAAMVHAAGRGSNP